MTTHDAHTPLWLELRKEYIDDNLDKLQDYLQRCQRSGQQDTFYEQTMELMRQRVQDLITQTAHHPLYMEEERDSDPLFDARLLATYLLAESDGAQSLPAYVALMGQLSLLHPRQTHGLLRATMQRLAHRRVVALGFAWSDLASINTEVFAHKACNLARFDTPLTSPMYYSLYGTAILSQDGIYLTHETLEGAKKLLRSGASSMQCTQGLCLRTVAQEKLRQSQETNVAGMMEYTKDFILEMCRQHPTQTQKRQPQYQDGDTGIVVRITAIDRDGTIHVTTTHPGYQTLQGTIRYTTSSLVYYYTDSLHTYFQPGDCLPATLVSAADATFSIEQEMIRYMVEEARQLLSQGGNLLCKPIDIREKFYVWMSEAGVPLHTRCDEDYGRDDYAYLSITRCGTGSQYGKIDAVIDGPCDEYDFDERLVRQDFLRRFVDSTPAPAAPQPTAQPTDRLDPQILHLLLRQLFMHQHSLFKPSERYRCLACAHVMAELLDDRVSASYIDFVSTYLRALVQFACHEDITHLQFDVSDEYSNSTPTLIRTATIDILREYGNPEYSQRLAATIEDFKDTIPVIARVARLVQTANSMLDMLSDASTNVIRREIIRTLSLETEHDTDLEADSGTYLGVESGTQEFKTSMVFPSDNNMQPDEQRQNLNIMRGLCAFLNGTSEATLYLGVNDQGYVTGIDQDMRHLKHTSIDSYMRYVQDRARRLLGLDTLPYLRIEPLFDARVVAIHVEPHPYRVVELDGHAYLRVNAESREMPENMRQELIARKMLTNKDRAAVISQLQHAITRQCCVMLHQYASSHSGTVRDRMVEAYDIRLEDGLVICYDRSTASTQKVKVFNLSRIGYVEVLEDQPWRFTQSHTPVEVDAFHMTGSERMHVSLRMDLFAKNILVEEYPATRTDLTQQRGDSDTWYYTASVYSIEPLARFYMGLAEHIDILDAPQLSQYVRQYVATHLQVQG